MDYSQLAIETLSYVMTMVAPAAFLWALVDRCASAIIRAASGRSDRGGLV